jgi:hypothetical protein
MSQDVSRRGTVGADFAGILLVIAGVVGILQGIAGIAKSGQFYVQPPHYVYTPSASAWGWSHVIVGLIVLAAGFGIFAGAAWARWLGIIFVSIQAVANFLFIPYAPFWAIALIVIDLWIIHSLAIHRREVL